MRKSLLLQFLISILFIISAASAVFADTEKEVLLMTYSSGGFQLDPAHSYTTSESQIYSAIYEGLVSYHPLTLEPIPAAASHWVVSPDGLTYTFFLRKEGKYWNGETVTANDFAETWFRLLDPEEDAEYSFMLDIIKGAYEYRSGETTDREEVGIKAVTPFTLEVTLRESAEYFLKILCHHSLSPVNPLNLDKGKWKKGPSAVGNGPFFLFSKTDDTAILKKNILYWDAENVKLDEIHINFSDDTEKTTELFNSGKIQWAPSGVYFGELDQPENIVTNPLFGTTYFFFKADEGPFSIPGIRRGLSLLLPWDRLRSPQAFFLPTETLVPSIPGYPDADGISMRNMREGLKLLHEAGFTKGKGLGTLKISIPDGRDSMYIAGLMKETWEKFLNINVEVSVYRFDEYYERLKEPGYDIGTTSWIGDYADPLTFLQMWTAESNLNDSGYEDPVYDELINDSVKEKDTKERYKLMSEAEKILLQNALVLPIENYPAFNAVNINTLQGWFPNVLDIHPFKYMYLQKPDLPRGTA